MMIQATALPDGGQNEQEIAKFQSQQQKVKTIHSNSESNRRPSFIQLSGNIFSPFPKQKKAPTTGTYRSNRLLDSMAFARGDLLLTCSFSREVPIIHLCISSQNNKWSIYRKKKTNIHGAINPFTACRSTTDDDRSQNPGDKNRRGL